MPPHPTPTGEEAWPLVQSALATDPRRGDGGLGQGAAAAVGQGAHGLIGDTREVKRTPFAG